MRSGQCSARETLGPLTAARGSGSWLTPTVGMTKHVGMTRAALEREAKRSLTAVGSHSTLTVQVASLCDWDGRLNPMWVEWLLGFPLGWTGLPPLATPRFRKWLRSHSTSCDAAAAGDPGPRYRYTDALTSPPLRCFWPCRLLPFGLWDVSPSDWTLRSAKPAHLSRNQHAASHHAEFARWVRLGLLRRTRLGFAFATSPFPPP